LGYIREPKLTFLHVIERIENGELLGREKVAAENLTHTSSLSGKNHAPEEGHPSR
jgi:hypothetical protein